MDEKTSGINEMSKDLFKKLSDEFGSNVRFEQDLKKKIDQKFKNPFTWNP